MLSAHSTRHFADSELATTIFLERRFRAHLVSRNRLLYDSAYSPAARKAPQFVHVYASLRGTLALDHESSVTGPQAYVLAETEFERVGAGARTFRSYGDPGVIVELRLSRRDLLVPVGLQHGALALPDAVWAAYHALAARPTEPALLAVMEALAEARIIARPLVESCVEREPEQFTRLWTVIRPLYEELQTSASLKQIAVLARLSLRQLGRDLADLTRTFGLFGGGFRDAMRVLRLRAAVLLLSAPAATPSEVAKSVGYGSLDAMGRAFRDAGLAAPSVVQTAVRYPE